MQWRRHRFTAVTRLAAITLNLRKCKDKCVCSGSISEHVHANHLSLLQRPQVKNKDRSCHSFDASCILKGGKTFRSIFKTEITPGSSSQSLIKQKKRLHFKIAVSSLLIFGISDSHSCSTHPSLFTYRTPVKETFWAFFPPKPPPKKAQLAPALFSLRRPWLESPSLLYSSDAPAAFGCVNTLLAPQCVSPQSANLKFSATGSLKMISTLTPHHPTPSHYLFFSSACVFLSLRELRKCVYVCVGSVIFYVSWTWKWLVEPGGLALFYFLFLFYSWDAGLMWCFALLVSCTKSGLSLKMLFL